MENDKGRRDFLKDMVDRLMDDLTDAAVDRFGEKARDLANSIPPCQMRPGWRDHDFVEVMLTRTVPWTQTMTAAYGRKPVEDLITDRMGQSMREFGERAAATSDGTPAGRVARALAPLPPDALTIADHEIHEDGVEFKVTRCRYAELLTQIGAADLGTVLVCNHDFAIAEGMGLRLERSTTLMRDRQPCDFHYGPSPPVNAPRSARAHR